MLIKPLIVCTIQPPRQTKMIITPKQCNKMYELLMTDYLYFHRLLRPPRSQILFFFLTKSNVLSQRAFIFANFPTLLAHKGV